MKIPVILFITAFGVFAERGVQSAAVPEVERTEVRAPNRALYIAPRTDNQAGTGTMTDPFNGSNATKLWQAWLKTAFRKDGVVSHTIVFLPGTYYCTNELRLPYDAKDVTISGYGARIVFADTALQGQRHILTTSWEGNDAITWEGFALDCGGSMKFAGSGKVCGVWTRGKNNIVRDITVRNLASKGDGYEAFGISLYSDGGLVRGCLVSGVAGETSLVTGICVNGNDCVTTGNVVDLGDTSATNGNCTFGFSLYGNRLLLSGNVARNVDAGISMDATGGGATNTWSDNVITGNILSGNEMAVRIDNNSQAFKDWLWTGNAFHARGRRWLLMATQNQKYKANKISGHRFIGNSFTGTTQEKNMYLSNWGGEPHVFIGNSFSSEPTIVSGPTEDKLYGEGNTVKGRMDNRAFRGRELNQQ